MVVVEDDDDDVDDAEEEEVLMLSTAGTVSSSLGDLERRRISGNGSCAAVTAAEIVGPAVAITVEGMSSISSRDDV